jgi:hypothetical protein
VLSKIISIGFSKNMLFKTLGDADLKSLKMPELVRQAVMDDLSSDDS